MSKYEIIEKAVGTFKNIASHLPDNAVKQGIQAISDTENISLSNISIPILTNDEDIKQFILEYKLQKPENMIKFFVESYYSNLECIIDSVNDLKLLNVIDSSSKIETAKNLFESASHMNEYDKRQILINAYTNLLEGINQLQDKTLMFIEKIREVDNMPKWKFILQSVLLLKEVDSNIKCIKKTVMAVIEARKMQMVIATELGYDIDEMVISQYENFKTKILSNNNFQLLQGYDDESYKAFWSKLPEEMEKTIETGKTIDAYLESAESDDEIDYDNIVFE